MNIRKIRALMVLKGIKVIDIAKMANVSPTTVSVVLTGKGTSRNIKQTIANALGRPYEKLWGKKAA